MRKFKMNKLAAGESVTVRFLDWPPPLYRDIANLAAADPKGLYPKGEHRCPLCEADIPLAGSKQEK